MYEYVSCDESGYVFLFYAVHVPFLVNVDITIKLHKFSTISRWIDNDNLHAKTCGKCPLSLPLLSSSPIAPSLPLPAPPSSLHRFCNFISRSFNWSHSFNRETIFLEIGSHLPKFSFSLQPMSVINANARRDKNATVICDIIILLYFDISYK